MMNEIDYDNDGIVSLSEWKRGINCLPIYFSAKIICSFRYHYHFHILGGLTTIPLLVLLGFDTVFVSLYLNFSLFGNYVSVLFRS